MAKRIKSRPQERGSVLFDIVFTDGSRASNRRVPAEILGGLDGDEPARQLIEEQAFYRLVLKHYQPPPELQP